MVLDPKHVLLFVFCFLLPECQITLRNKDTVYPFVVAKSRTQGKESITDPIFDAQKMTQNLWVARTQAENSIIKQTLKKKSSPLFSPLRLMPMV